MDGQLAHLLAWPLHLRPKAGEFLRMGVRRRCWPERSSGWETCISDRLQDQTVIARLPWWVLYVLIETITWMSRCLAGAGCLFSDGSRTHWALEHTSPLHMSCSVGHMNKPSLFPASERTELVKAIEKQTVLPCGKSSLSSLLLKQNESGSALSSGLSHWSVPR